VPSVTHLGPFDSRLGDSRVATPRIPSSLGIWRVFSTVFTAEKYTLVREALVRMIGQNGITSTNRLSATAFHGVFWCKWPSLTVNLCACGSAAIAMATETRDGELKPDAVVLTAVVSSSWTAWTGKGGFRNWLLANSVPGGCAVLA
jgi:hypothetical protein